MASDGTFRAPISPVRHMKAHPAKAEAADNTSEWLIPSANETSSGAGSHASSGAGAPEAGGDGAIMYRPAPPAELRQLLAQYDLHPAAEVLELADDAVELAGECTQLNGRVAELEHQLAAYQDWGSQLQEALMREGQRRFELEQQVANLTGRPVRFRRTTSNSAAGSPDPGSRRVTWGAVAGDVGVGAGSEAGGRMAGPPMPAPPGPARQAVAGGGAKRQDSGEAAGTPRGRVSGWVGRVGSLAAAAVVFGAAAAIVAIAGTAFAADTGIRRGRALSARLRLWR